MFSLKRKRLNSKKVETEFEIYGLEMREYKSLHLNKSLFYYGINIQFDESESEFEETESDIWTEYGNEVDK